MHQYPERDGEEHRSLWKFSGLTRNFFFKLSQNSPIIYNLQVLIFWGSIPYVFFLYRLLKVVSRYDLSVLSMSVIGLHKKRLDKVVSYVQFFLRICGKCLILQIPLIYLPLPR